MKPSILIPFAALVLGSLLSVNPAAPEPAWELSAAELPAETSSKFTVKIVEAHMNVSPFTSIHSDVVATMRYVPSDRYRIEAEGPERIISAIDVRVEKGVLRITTSKKNLKMRRGERLSLTVYGRELKAIRLDGVGSFKCSERLEAPLLEVFNTGVGSINIDDLQCNEVVVKNEGVGTITLKGQTGKASIASDGVGSIYAYDLQSCNTIVHLNGVGSVQCHASESGEFINNGVGSILYKGRPETLSVHKNGIGSISAR